MTLESAGFARRASVGAAALLVALGACKGDGTTTNGAPLCAADPAPAPLRRMTRFEYGRTIADLTGVAATVAETLPPDEETMDFDDIASAYSVSSLHAARYLDVAEQAGAAPVSMKASRVASAGPSSGAGAVAPTAAGSGR